MKRVLVIAVVAAFGAALGGCAEREQSALYKDGKYRGKPDTQPWDNAPAAYGAGMWTKGDHESWENQLRARNITAQNEHRRIGH
ncbi:MAG TPA: hypothetical protein VFC18_14465 [Burkholderiales bacterium]|nr:hypothetical protein [Burkholderiales bacterium]